jgi:hypothetical protein
LKRPKKKTKTKEVMGSNLESEDTYVCRHLFVEIAASLCGGGRVRRVQYLQEYESVIAMNSKRRSRADIRRVLDAELPDLCSVYRDQEENKIRSEMSEAHGL